MADRVSALDGHYEPGLYGPESEQGPGVILQQVPNLSLCQVAAWPDTLVEAGACVRQAAGVDRIPGPGRAVVADQAAVLRIEPLKCWLIGVTTPTIDPQTGVSLDLSHSRTRIRISGREAVAFLNRFLPLDLRQGTFAEGSVASSALHHVGVTLWRSSDGYELFIPRGFALSCWEVVLESARQFYVEVR
jgi:heterotetrameric sarcosine oxidase gamma subunit